MILLNAISILLLGLSVIVATFSVYRLRKRIEAIGARDWPMRVLPLVPNCRCVITPAERKRAAASLARDLQGLSDDGLISRNTGKGPHE